MCVELNKVIENMHTDAMWHDGSIHANAPTYATVCFLSYALSGGVFKASVIFTTIQLFNVLRGPVSQFPSALSQFASLIVATRRIGAFLKREETTEKLEGVSFNTDESPVNGESCIVIKDGKFIWGKKKA